MPYVAQEIQATLDMFKQGLVTKSGTLVPDIAKDWNLASGFQAYNLEAPAKVLVPQLTPLRNVTARKSGKGKQVEYKAITALNNTNLNGWVAEGTAASIVQTSTSDITAVYRSMALADKVTFESQWAGQGFGDIKSLAVTNLLRATMIQEENNILFGQNSTAATSTQQSPGAVGAAATLATPTTLTTGGTIGAATAYYFKQTVVTGMGESLPSAASATVTTGGGATNSITVTPVATAGQPVLGYRIWASTAANGTYYPVVAANCTSSSSGTLNGISWFTNGQALVITSIPTTGAAIPAADNTSSANAYNGLLAQIFGGASATITALNGTLTTTAINTLFQGMWNTGRADPNMVIANAQESIKITALTLGAGAPYFIVPAGGQGDATANFRVARFTNAATGSEVPITVHPSLPQGTMLALSTRLPGWYVPTDIDSVWALDLPQDYIEIDYPPTQSNPFWQVEVRLFGTLKLYLPLLQGVLTGINIS